MTATLADRATDLGPRLLPRDVTRRETLSEYLALGGYHQHSWDLSPAGLRSVVAESGLRGRGGSAFPAGRKWESVAAQPGLKVVLVNAAESEPASYKDRLLLSSRPHLVIEGALLAARAIGADDCVLYLHEGEPVARAAVEAALIELQAARMQFITWRLVEAPARYVSGEESAAVRKINGGPALPTFKPPRPFEQGIDERPTLVHNVETLANVPLIARNGSTWFRNLGTSDAPGTMLITLSGSVKHPGVCEVPIGARLSSIIDELGGGTDDRRPVQAILPGGYFSGWIDGAALRAGVRLDRESLASHGALPGSGAISIVSSGVCGLAQATSLVEFFAEESARQCGVCSHGTTAMAEAFARIVRGDPRSDDLKQLRRWSRETLPGRGACGHLDGAAIAVRTALDVFADEIGKHARFGTCGRPARIVLPGLEGRSLDVNIDSDRRSRAGANQPAALRQVRVLQ